MKKLLVVLALALVATGCTDATKSKIFGLGDQFKIEMYSGGVKVREWTSTGKVLSEKSSDGYYFTDKATGKLVEVSGDCVITQL